MIFDIHSSEHPVVCTGGYMAITALVVVVNLCLDDGLITTRQRKRRKRDMGTTQTYRQDPLLSSLKQNTPSQTTTPTSPPRIHPYLSRSY